MGRNDPLDEPNSSSLIIQAVRYVQTAELAIANAPEQTRVEIADPVRFLCFHAVELALKSFLKSKGRQILDTELMTHNLVRLFEACKADGLKVDAAPAFEYVFGLIVRSNERNNLRYYNAYRGGGGASTAVTIANVRALVVTVRASLPSDALADPDEEATKLNLTIDGESLLADK